MHHKGQSVHDSAFENFLLCKRDGWNHKTIAGKFNISTSTVNNLIIQAIKKIKEGFSFI
jgi:DNA-directed RNA polymerase specialized sigma24 family protein